MRAIGLCDLVLAFSFSLNHLVAEEVSLRLIPEQKEIQPGQSLCLAVELVFPAGWYTYWINPGDAGAPPRFSWDIPSNSTVPHLFFPVPYRYESEGLVSFGHPSPLRILAEWVAPESLAPGESLTIGLSAEWLICRDICKALNASGSITLPVVSKQPTPNPDHRALFSDLRNTIPVHNPEWNFSVETEKNEWILNVRPPPPLSTQAPEGIFFFCRQPGVVDPSVPVESKPLPDGWSFRLGKGVVAPSPNMALEGILQVTGWNTSVWVKARWRSPDRDPVISNGAHERVMLP